MAELQLLRRPAIAWWLLAGLLACALKWCYSVATVGELDWMLRPVALLLQMITGHGFQRADDGEWFSAAAGIVLVKGCAGVNFMIMSFIGWCWLARPLRSASLSAWALLEWPVLLAAALVMAWAVAVPVNVTRILGAIATGALTDGWLGAEQTHRLVGLAICLPALCAQLVIGDRRHAGQAALVATGIYVALMVVTPLLTGNAYAKPAQFMEYSVTVLALAGPVALWGVWGTVTSVSVNAALGDAPAAERSH